MKKLKKNVLTVALSFTSLTMVVSSCNPKTFCEVSVCQNGGSCIDNKCKCPAGFTGEFCETALPTTFISDYNVIDVMLTPTTFSCSIINGPAANKIIIKNPCNLNFEFGNPTQVEAILNANGTEFTIAKQAVTGTPNAEIEAKGSLVGNVVTVDYKLYFNGALDVENPNAKWVKK